MYRKCLFEITLNISELKFTRFILKLKLRINVEYLNWIFLPLSTQLKPGSWLYGVEKFVLQNNRILHKIEETIIFSQ